MTERSFFKDYDGTKMTLRLSKEFKNSIVVKWEIQSEHQEASIVFRTTTKWLLDMHDKIELVGVNHFELAKCSDQFSLVWMDTQLGFRKFGFMTPPDDRAPRVRCLATVGNDKQIEFQRTVAIPLVVFMKDYCSL